MPTIKRVQGGLVHIGKIPANASKQVVSKRRIDELKIKLRELIALEDFEEAAKVRDEINQLRKDLEVCGKNVE